MKMKKKQTIISNLKKNVGKTDNDALKKVEELYK